MKTKNLLNIAVAAIATLSVLGSCQDENQGFTYQDIRDAEYTKNFEQEYGAIAPDQIWDFSTDNLVRLGLAGGPTSGSSQPSAATRASEGYTDATISTLYGGHGSASATYTLTDETNKVTGATNITNLASASIPDGWYELDNDLDGSVSEVTTLEWLNENLKERVNNRAMGKPFSFSEPKNGIMIIPIYQGQAGMRWDLHLVDEKAKKDYNIWSRSEGLLYAATPESETQWIKPMKAAEGDFNGYKYEHTISKHVDTDYNQNDQDLHRDVVIGRPMYINKGTLTGDAYLYLKVTKGSNNFANTGAEQSSQDHMMLALPCARPTNLNAFINNQITAGRISQEEVLPGDGSKCQAMIIGCEDADLDGSDWDMNDVVFLVVGFPLLPDLKEVTRKRYMIEDLGSTFDFDFNDIVVDVTQEVNYRWTFDGTQTVKELDGISTKATLKHLCGTIPFKIQIGNTVLGSGNGIHAGKNAGSGLGGDGYDPTNDSNYADMMGVDIDGWDPVANNIVVTSWPSYAGWEPYTNQNNGLLTYPQGAGETYGFPETGHFPYIIACDQNVDWMQELKSVPASWFSTWPQTYQDYPYHSDDVDLNNITKTDFTLSIYQLVNAGASDDTDVIRFNIQRDTNDDRNNWGLGGLFKVDTDKCVDEWKGKSGTSWYYEYTFKQIKEWAGTDNALRVNIWNQCKVTSIEVKKPVTYTLTLKQAAHGTATQSNADGKYAEGMSATVTATPDAGYHFVKWSEDGNTSRVRVIVMNSNITLTPVFAEGEPEHLWNGQQAITDWSQNPEFDLDFGSKTAQAGDKLVIKTNQRGDGMNVVYIRDPWSSVSATWNESTSSYVLELTQEVANALNQNLKVTLSTNNLTVYTIDLVKNILRTVSVSTTGNGSVSIDGQSGTSATLSESSSVTIKATPNSGYRFVKWTKGGNDISGAGATYNFTLSETTAGEYVAAFAEVATYKLTLASNDSSMGSVSANPDASNGIYTEGTEVTVTATPNTGHKFVSWSDGGAQSHSVTMNENRSLTATFAINTYTFTLEAVTGVMYKINDGEAVASYSQEYDWNSEVKVQVVCDDTHNFAGWADGSNDNPRTFTVSDNISTKAIASTVGAVNIFTGSQTMNNWSGASFALDKTKVAQAISDGKRTMTINFSSCATTYDMYLQTSWSRAIASPSSVTVLTTTTSVSFTFDAGDDAKVTEQGIQVMVKENSSTTAGQPIVISSIDME